MSMSIGGTGSTPCVTLNTKFMLARRYLCKNPTYSDHVISPGEDGCQDLPVLFKRNRHHRGSVYTVAWNPAGNVIATGGYNFFRLRILHHVFLLFIANYSSHSQPRV